MAARSPAGRGRYEHIYALTMSDATPGRPRKAKKPKVLQVLTTDDGRIAGFVYDTGRMFIYHPDRSPDPFAGTDGFWLTANQTDTRPRVEGAKETPSAQ
jgi:hypothetical protein